ncbi:hypothetical protein DYGSA30_28320 [Dyella sp. GSA-30]|nr:hypothetical protein DYGSA30_28320 [Dyella sp. GSA-30]
MDFGVIDLAFIKADDGKAAMRFGKAVVDMTSSFEMRACLYQALIEQMDPGSHCPGVDVLFQQ